MTCQPIYDYVSNIIIFKEIIMAMMPMPKKKAATKKAAPKKAAPKKAAPKKSSGMPKMPKRPSM